MAAKFQPGSVIAGRYRLDRLLGEGGMGSVWAVTHTVTRRRLALKLLKAQERAGMETRHRFMREARAACAVEHPHILPVHDVFERDDGTPVMVMDLLEGETLRDRLELEGRLPLQDAARLLLPVVSAVGAAHEHGIVHRDLKPENVFLVDKGDAPPHVMVLDFGIAKLTGGEDGQTGDADTVDAGLRTGTGAVLGSPCYMAPEQGSGESDVDHRADIWALGIMLYEALAGARPIDGANFGQVLKQLLTKEIPPLQSVAPEVPDDVVQLVAHMLTRERDQRPADLREVATVLTRHAGRKAPSFGPAGSRPSQQGDTPPSNGALGSKRRGAKRASERGPRVSSPSQQTPAAAVVTVAPARSRGLSFAMGAAAVGLIAVGMWWLGGNYNRDSPADGPAVASPPGALDTKTEATDPELPPAATNETSAPAAPDEADEADAGAREPQPGQVAPPRRPVPPAARRRTPAPTATATAAAPTAATTAPSATSDEPGGILSDAPF